MRNRTRTPHEKGRFLLKFVVICYILRIGFDVRNIEGVQMSEEKQGEIVVEKKYDKKKWKKIIDTTQSNYANMIKRLSRKNKVSNFVLIYYSIFLIIATLTSKYFPWYFNSKLGEYFGIILSVIVLAYSLVNNSANYAVRIANIETALNKLKTIKRGLEDRELEECVREYNEITDATERRDDVDFFITVKHLCNEYDINWVTKKRKKKTVKKDENRDEEYKKQEEVVNNYISEINVLVEEGKIISEFIWNAILFLVPMLIFVLCIIFSDFGKAIIKSRM